MESRVKVGLCRNYPSPEGRDQIHESDGSEAVELSVPGGTGHTFTERFLRCSRTIRPRRDGTMLVITSVFIIWNYPSPEGRDTQENQGFTVFELLCIQSLILLIHLS